MIYALSRYAFAVLQNFKKVRKLKYQPFQNAEFFFALMKRNEMKVAENSRVMMITQTVGWSCCGQSGSSVLEFRFQLVSIVYTYTVDHMY
jgi:hypothetical protein